MKKLILPVCGAVLLAGCCSGRYECAPVADCPSYFYRRPLPRLRPLSPEPCEITRTQEAQLMRRRALHRTLEAEVAESQIYTSTPAQPSGTGVSTFLPPGYAVGSRSGIVPPGPPLGPSPVAEGNGGCPVASPVQGKPGFVVSPFTPNGYVDVTGMAPGSEARDPYTGKVFRVP